MEITAVVIFAALGFAIFFFVLKRLLRMAIRVAVVGAVLLALVVGAAAWWWYAPFGSSDANVNRNAGARPARSPRR